MKEIKLTQGKLAIVDDEDFEFLTQYNWYLDKYKTNTYAHTIVKGKNYKMHRLILRLTDSNIHVDHKDGNGLNNQKTNLRIATIGENNLNRKVRYNSFSKYKGVHLNTRKWKDKTYTYWRAIIGINNKNYSIGNFKTEKGAALAYNKKAIELHGEFANLNKVA